MHLKDVLINLKGLFVFLKKKRIIILCVSLLAGILGVVYAWTSKPSYIAEMTFATESDNSLKLGNYAGIAAQFGFDLGGGGNSIFEGNSLVELLKSQLLVEKTLLSPIDSSKDSPLMIELYITNHSIKSKTESESFTGLFRQNAPDKKRLHDSLLQAVYMRIYKSGLDVAKKDKSLDFITITMKDNNEIYAKRFVDLLTTNAIDFYTLNKTRKSAYNVQILQRQTDSVRNILFGNISELANINDLNINPSKQIGRSPSQRKQVDMQVNVTLYGELLKNLELAKLMLRKDTPLIQVINNDELPLTKKKMGRLLGGILFAMIAGVLTCSFYSIKYFLNTSINS